MQGRIVFWIVWAIWLYGCAASTVQQPTQPNTRSSALEKTEPMLESHDDSDARPDFAWLHAQGPAYVLAQLQPRVVHAHGGPRWKIQSVFPAHPTWCKEGRCQLQVGDEISTVNGQAISTPSSLAELWASLADTAVIEIVWYREGQRYEHRFEIAKTR